MKNENIYEMVNAKIMEKLEAGVIPWRKPWVGGNAVNWKTQKPYRGMNAIMLDAGEYATFNQIKEAGGKVKKGAKSEIIVFWKILKKENEDGEVEKLPLLKYYRVFNIEKDVEGLEPKQNRAEFKDHDPIEEADKIFKGYINCPSYTFHMGGAWYKPAFDMINVPPMKAFTHVEEFYCTLFHEMAHSTGHESRLKREGIKNVAAFGSNDYSKEELIAEMTASMLCGVAGIDNSTLDNSAAYIQSWLRALKDDKTMLVQAAGKAQKAADYILGTTFEEAAE
jgi:antirestriction protein ArdC